MEVNIPNFPQEQKHSHFVAILSIFVVIVIAFLVYVVYMYQTTRDAIVVDQPIPLVNQRVALTPEQSAEKKRIIEGTDNTQIKLTAQEKEDKLAKIKQASGINNQ